jgi:lipopolysaccharide export system permease protein
MCVMVLFRIADPIAMGGSLRLIGIIFVSGLPAALGFSIPVSIMTAALLTFGKLSANGEITAMKSSGIRMLQIMRQPMIFAALMSTVCLYLNTDIIPSSYAARREALRQLGTENPMQLIEDGRTIYNFPGIAFYVGSKEDNNLKDILIYQTKKGSTSRTIRAKHGTVTTSEDKQSLVIDLYDVRVDPFYDDKPGPGHASHFPFVIDLKKKGANDSPKMRKKSDMTMDEIIRAMGNVATLYPGLPAEEQARLHAMLSVEFHKRIVMGLACFAFVMLGAPLATRTHRQETSVGIGISLGLVFIFYLFIIVAETMTKHPILQPHLITWIPIALAMFLGIRLIRRCD